MPTPRYEKLTGISLRIPIRLILGKRESYMKLTAKIYIYCITVKILDLDDTRTIPEYIF